MQRLAWEVGDIQSQVVKQVAYPAGIGGEPCNPVIYKRKGINAGLAWEVKWG